MLAAVLFGYYLGGGFDSNQGDQPTTTLTTSSADIYLNLLALPRIKDHEDIITSCTGWLDFFTMSSEGGNPYNHRSYSYSDLFKMLQIRNPEDFTVLRITRQLGDTHRDVNFWFEFIQTEKLIPLAEIPDASK